jgi:hypothetical protein
MPVKQNPMTMKNKEKDMRTIEQTSERISPEAMSAAKWLEHLDSLGLDEGRNYILSLLETNGSTEAPPADGIIVWGLRSTASGRWIGNRDADGVDCLQAFSARDLAELFHRPGNEVVWMDVRDWLRKVEDVAKTGFPPTINLLYGIEDGQVITHTWSCKALADTPWVFPPFLHFNLKRAAGVASVMVDHADETETGHAGGTRPLLQERRELACANGGEQTSWNQRFADDGYCPYCGTINWERDLDFDWDEERQECKCELCGAEWWEVLTPTPKKPVLDPGISAVSN